MAMNADAPIDHSLPAGPAVVVFGSGICARTVAANLAHIGCRIWVAAETERPTDVPAQVGVEWLFDGQLDHCRGFAGAFQIQLKHRHGVMRRTVSAVVVADDPIHRPNYAAYGLTPGPRVLDISTLESMVAQTGPANSFADPATILFLGGWEKDAHPSVVMRMLTAGAALQQMPGITTCFTTGNLKVAADGAEALVARSKRAGALFIKWSQDFPVVVSEAEGGFFLDYVDELTGGAFRLTADWIVVDEEILPGRRIAALRHGFGIEGDADGFAQSDNVRRLTNATNRRGIFVAGGARDRLSVEAQRIDADQVSLAVAAFLRGVDVDPRPPAVVQRGRCARCLTCHRLCPHMAVDIGAPIAIVADACRRCGLCVAGCPAQAIDMPGVPAVGDIQQRLVHAPMRMHDAPATPAIMLFGCARSAGQAMELIRLGGRRLPASVHFVEVPCGGSIAGRHLLGAFEAGAEGVMLCVCHTDNCLSPRGNQIARQRAAVVENLLRAAGTDPRRLRITPLAANMDNALAGAIETFIAEIDDLNEP